MAITWHVTANMLKRLNPLKWKSMSVRRESLLAPQQCTVEFNHSNCNSVEVGTVTRVTLNLRRQNSAAYSLKPTDTFSCRVTCDSTPDIPMDHVIHPQFLVGQIRIHISFTAHIVGRYNMELKVNDTVVGQTPACVTYIPGAMDTAKSDLSGLSDPKIVTQGSTFVLYVTPRDKYGNATNIKKHLLRMSIKRNSRQAEAVLPNLVVCKSTSRKGSYELRVRLNESGHFKGNVTYSGQTLGIPNFTIICLTERSARMVDTHVARRERCASFDASMLTGKKSTKVNCLFTAQALDIRQKKLGFVPHRVYACKLSPCSKITLEVEANVFTLDNGIQEPIRLSSPHRYVIAALFSRLALESVGGSDSYKRKQQCFSEQLREHHRMTDGQTRKRIAVYIKRRDVLKSAMKSTKKWSKADWLKKMDIVFEKEDGVDFGGPSREFINLLSAELFNSSRGLFVRLDEHNQQAPVHPNYRNTNHKLFEFAGKIVAKCVVECAFSNTLLVKAKFTRSFLAQLLGLKVSHSYYSTDDPMYFTSKIQYTLENDVTDDELFFTDTADGAALIPHGQKERVTEGNKVQYLNALAYYRLAKRPNKQIQSFLKGFTSLVPCELLLTFFTENELELLICGTKEVRYENMRKFTVVEGEVSSGMLSWFWQIVQRMTPEERAMLLQFATGSATLPPGGFEELLPPFSISFTPDKERLPSAHTCVNQLYLPEYGTYEKLQASLMTALRSSEGFQLC